jgi:Tol biopolymer transport system component
MKIKPLIPAQALLVGLAMVSLTGSVAAATFQSVSVRDPGQTAPAGGSGDSWTPILTPDGRYVLFSSLANNLVLNATSNALPVSLAPHLNVFLRDRTSSRTTLVSANLAGTGGGNGDSLPTAISDDGRFVLFESGASDLVSGDTNGVTDVFLRDMISNVTYLVSVSTNGGFANGVCRGSTMTPDGSLVAFVSAANNLVHGDTNGVPDVFVRDMLEGTTILVSAGARASNSYALTASEAPDITLDGRFVLFYTTATNLVAGGPNGGADIYLRDLWAGTTRWVSSSARAVLGNSFAVSFNYSAAEKAAFIAYEACTNFPSAMPFGRGVILRFNLYTGLTDIIHTNAYVPPSNPEEIHTLEITSDGRFITFVANTNGAPGTTCILRWDAESGLTTLVSADLAGHASTNAVSDSPTIDPTGRFVAFLSRATNLVANPLQGDYHLYLRDIQSGTTTLLDADTNGVGSGVSPATAPRLSADASVVAFESPDAGLVANDRNRDYDVFVRNLAAGTNELISARDPVLPSLTPNGPNAISPYSVSADGRLVAFTSEADNLAPNCTNGFRNVFVRDMFASTTILASVATNGGPADGICSEPAISGNGRYVVFTSAADNLAPGDTNRASDVFVRDLQAGTTTLVSVNTNGTGAGNALSETPIVGSDGRLILFRSRASNLAPGSFTATENLFVRDTQVPTTYALTFAGLSSASMTPDGTLVAYADNAAASAGKIYIWDTQAATRIETNTLPAALSSLPMSIAPNGTKVASLAGTSGIYVVDRVAQTNGLIATGYSMGSRVGLRFSADARFLTYAAAPSATSSNQVYLHDFTTQSNLLVSAVFGMATGGNAASDWPEINADGRFIAYRSFATNLLAIPTSNSVPNLYLYNRVSGISTLLSASTLTGGPGDNRSLSPVFSGDGHMLLIQSWASDLAPGDFNHWDDIFAQAFFYATISPGKPPGVGPIVTWPARPGETYEVQFKDHLEDSFWRPVKGSVLINGSQASLIDDTPTAGTRFYRVVAH